MSETTPIDFFIRPDIRRKRLTIECPPGFAGSCVIDETENRADTADGHCIVPFPEFSLWAPASPTLYTLRCETEGKTPVTIRFGMRECTAKDERFYLNTRPVGFDFLQLHEPTENYVKAAKEAGFNGIRLDADGLNPDILSRCDTIGLMVYADLSVVADPLPLVESYRNHPSIVLWRTAAHGEAIQTLDPSRLIVEAKSQDAIARGFVPYQRESRDLELLTIAQPFPLSRLAEEYIRRTGGEGRLSIIDTQPVIRNSTIGAAAPSKSVRALAARSVRRQIDAAALNPAVAGICTSLVAEQESQSPKPFAALRPVIHLAKTNLVPRETVDFQVSVVNHERYEGEAAVSLQLVGPTNQVLWKKKRVMRIPRHGQVLWESSISASGATGPHSFIVRVMVTGRPMVEERRELVVYEPAPRSDVETYILRPTPRLANLCEPYIHAGGENAPVLVVPPPANTVRAWADNELVSILGQAKSGAVAIFFSPPDDWNDFADRIDPVLRATNLSVVRPGSITVHENKLHPVFEGLPAGDTMLETYRDILPWKTFEEESDEDISRCRWVSEEADATGTNVLVRAFGSGRVVFTHLRILERLGVDPVADRLLGNILRHFSRRAVPSSGSLPEHTRAVEWLKKERAARFRKWKLIGLFPPAPKANENGVFPPETEQDFDAAYPGPLHAIEWRDWHTKADDGHQIDFGEALEPGTNVNYESPGTAYAFAEFASEQRLPVILRLTTPHAAKLWLNEKLLPEATGGTEALLRQGRNTVLIKVTSGGQSCRAGLAIETKGEPAVVRWWR